MQETILRNKKSLLLIIMAFIFIIIMLSLSHCLLIHFNHLKQRNYGKTIDGPIKDFLDIKPEIYVPIVPNEEPEPPAIEIPLHERANSIPILAYHSFMWKQDRQKYAKDDKYTMNIEDFDEQLNYLYQNGYHTIDYRELYQWLKGEIELDNKSFMITIDDGNISAYHLALPVIEKYNYSAIIFVIVGRLKPTSIAYDPQTVGFFGDDIVKDIEDHHKAITLGSHSTYLHATIDGKNPMEVLSYEDLLNDLSVSKQRLNTDVFAYPFGMYNEAYLNATKNAGFKMAFTFKPSGRARRTNGVYEIPRININSEVSFRKFKRLVETDW